MNRRFTLALAAGLVGAIAFAMPAHLFAGIDAVLGGLGSTLGIDLLTYPFVQRALVSGLAVGVVAPVVGTFLVYRRMALIGDALAHTAFAGVAIGLLVGSVTALPVSPTLAALAVAVVAALGIEWLTERIDEAGDVSMAIVLTGGFALGTVVISLTDGGLSVGINQYLFGSLVTVTRAEASLLLVFASVVLGAVAVTYRQLVAVTLDETAARVAGLDVRRYNRLLVVLTAVVVVAAMQILGVILVIAMLVVPVATAARTSRGFTHAVVVSVVVAEIAVVGGIAVASVADVAVGGTIVLFAIGLYVASAVGVRPLATRSSAKSADR